MNDKTMPGKARDNPAPQRQRRQGNARREPPPSPERAREMLGWRLLHDTPSARWA